MTKSQSRNERLSRALRDNLGRRKALARSKDARKDAEPADPRADVTTRREPGPEGDPRPER